MSDQTAVRSRPQSRRRAKTPTFDFWFGLMPGGRCLYCGHSQWHHNGRALMAARTDQRRRTRVGVKWLACDACYAKHPTQTQVMCYQAAEALILDMERVGLVVS